MSRKKKNVKVLVGIGIAALLIVGIVFLISQVAVPAVRRSRAYKTYGDTLKSLKVGDTMTFGTYEQDGDVENGAEPIEWTVLDEKDGKILLISEKCLDCQPYHNSYTGVVWEKSSLRTWLNKTFVKAAFTDEERSILASVALDNSYPLVVVGDDAVTDYGIYEGKATSDQVFLLSVDEAEAYLSGDLLTPAITPYAKERGAYENSSHGNHTWWWLRTTGTFSNYVNIDGDVVNMENTAATVNSDGTLDKEGDAVSRESGAVRPAIWITLPQ